MSEKLDDILGLIEAECPLTWAHENLSFLDQGDRAAIFHHPTNPNLVVRVTDYPDGWFAYTDKLQESEVVKREAGDDISMFAHGPRVYDMAYVSGCFIAISEKLEPIEADDPAEDWVEIASAILLNEVDDMNPNAVAEFDKLQPLFRSFRKHLPDTLRDIKTSNWLLRDRTLVLNDPKGSMTFFEEEVLKRTLERSPIPAIAI